MGFRAVYHRPFLEQWPDQDTAAEMLEIVSDAILDLDLEQAAHFRIHGRFPQLLRIHFAQSLVSLD